MVINVHAKYICTFALIIYPQNTAMQCRHMLLQYLQMRDSLRVQGNSQYKTGKHHSKMLQYIVTDCEVLS